MAKYLMRNTCNYNDYEVYASFRDGSRIFADIIKKTSEATKIDAYLILINPGSCSEVPGTIRYDADGFSLSRAVPDPAMRCVMRLMEKCSFDKVRILNLIDCQNAVLSEILNDVKSGKISPQESIFSDERFKEFNTLTKEDAPFILAWGVNKSLDDFKKMALKRLNTPVKRQMIGIPGKDGGLSFKYIKPWSAKAQDEIIDELSRQLENFILS